MSTEVAAREVPNPTKRRSKKSPSQDQTVYRTRGLKPSKQATPTDESRKENYQRYETPQLIPHNVAKSSVSLSVVVRSSGGSAIPGSSSASTSSTQASDSASSSASSSSDKSTMSHTYRKIATRSFAPASLLTMKWNWNVSPSNSVSTADASLSYSSSRRKVKPTSKRLEALAAVAAEELEHSTSSKRPRESPPPAALPRSKKSAAASPASKKSIENPTTKRLKTNTATSTATCPISNRALQSYKGSKNDVILGRGNAIAGWPGNEAFRKVIQRHRPSYHVAYRNCKQGIAKKAVQEIYDKGGKFVEFNGKKFVQVTDQLKVLEKACQALRERKWIPKENEHTK